ncbi:MAG: ABC transporter permease subunit [Acidobacteriota bacterium]
MRWSEWSALLRKDARELFGSTAFLLILLMTGPLVGLSFITAVRAYAEASGGGAAALASALTPLDGILVPTLGAYDLVITFLLPFLAIRVIAGEKTSGALELLLQSPVSTGTQLASKMTVLLLGWLTFLLPAGGALLLWRSYGGHLAATETANLLLGHTLRFLLTCSVSLAAASMMTGAASAAILVLTLTIGTWALDFFAAGRGGWIAALGQFTPAAALRRFERGLTSLDVILAAVVATLLFCALAAAFLDLRLSPRRRGTRVVVIMLMALLSLTLANVEGSADVSEDRRNSFSAADERLLASIDAPLTIRLHLAAEDPRAGDYERNVLDKLRRTVPNLRVEYPYAGRSALFEDDQRYGTIVYRLGTKEVVSRSTTEEIVLDDLEQLAGLTPPQREESFYPGYPLNTEPRGAAPLFYLAWPVLVGAAWIARALRSFA